MMSLCQAVAVVVYYQLRDIGRTQVTNDPRHHIDGHPDDEHNHKCGDEYADSS